MRIGIFTNCYRPLVNGVVGAVSLLRKGFLEAEHEVYIFTPAFDQFQDDEPNIYRYPAVDLTRKVKYPIAIPFSRSIDRVLDNLALDIIHTHHPFVLGPLSLKIARRKQVPLVYTFHTQYDQYSHYIPLPKQLVNWSARNQVRHFCQGVNQVTTPADSAKQILLGYGVTKPIQVIPNPTLLSTEVKDGNLIRNKYGLKAEKLLINIGRIAPEKNLIMLLKAFRYMLDKAPDGSLKLMIVGDGPELENLKQQSRQLGVEQSVIFTGLVEPVTVPDYLAAADLFVMTSTSEVKPLSQLEALAAGVPIVAVSAAGANDTIIHGQNGLLVDLSEDEVGEAVLGLVFDQAKLSRFQQAAIQSASQYSYPVIAAEYLKLFEQVIEDYREKRHEA